MIHKILLLILMVSCTHKGGPGGGSFKKGEAEARTIGFDLDSLSLSRLDKRVLEKRSTSLENFGNSSEALSEQLLLDVLSKEFAKDLPSRLMKEVQKEKLSVEDTDSSTYRILLSYLKQNDYGKVFYFLPRLFVSKSVKYQARAYNIQGILELGASRVASALTSFEEAYRLNPEDESVRLNLAVLRFEYGLWKEAGELLSEKMPHPLGVFLGDLLKQREEGTPLTLKSCESYIKRFPKNKIFLFNCGQVAFHHYKNLEFSKRWLTESLTVGKEYSFIDKKTKEVLKKIGRRG